MLQAARPMDGCLFGAIGRCIPLRWLGQGTIMALSHLSFGPLAMAFVVVLAMLIGIVVGGVPRWIASLRRWRPSHMWTLGIKTLPIGYRVACLFVALMAANPV